MISKKKKNIKKTNIKKQIKKKKKIKDGGNPKIKNY